MKELLQMSKQEVNRAGILQQVADKKLSQIEAARVMGLSDRQVRRLVSRLLANGPKSIIHGLRGKPSNRRLDETLKDEAVALVKELYPDFGPTFAAEKLAENHDIQIGHEVLRQLMIREDIWRFKQRTVTHRNRRERRSCYGEMEQFDGCRHDWFEDRGPKVTLLASRDDANNTVRASFAEYEGTAPVMAFWKAYMLQHGKPQSIYLDRHGTYKVNAKSALDDPEMISQFERAMEELGIEVIHAWSPQAKGRIENLFGTLQDRLVKELRLAGIANIADANRFLAEIFLPAYNERFCVLPTSAANVHWPVSSREDLDQVLSVQSERLVNRDFTIRFKARWLQLTKTQPTLVVPKTKVVLEERLDGSLHVRLGRHYLEYKSHEAKPAPKPLPIALTSSPKPRVRTVPGPQHPWRRFTIKLHKPDISTLQGIGHF